MHMRRYPGLRSERTQTELIGCSPHRATSQSDTLCCPRRRGENKCNPWCLSTCSILRNRTMNFYPPPPTVKAELFVRIPDHLRCRDEPTEWTGGFVRPFQHIFLEGPVADKGGNLWIVDIPYGRILCVSSKGDVAERARWDGEPNGLAATHDGNLVVADYKQVSRARRHG